MKPHLRPLRELLEEPRSDSRSRAAPSPSPSHWYLLAPRELPMALSDATSFFWLANTAFKPV